jgi:predicted transposase/invertase (TIGR01784 family)
MNTYEEREKRDRDRRAIEAYQREEIYEKGMEKGMEKGREEEKIEIARNLLKLGLTLESITQATGLDLKTLKKL